MGAAYTLANQGAAGRRLWVEELVLGSVVTISTLFLQQQPIRQLRSQFNDSIDDHSYMGFDRSGVGFMIPDEFFHIGKWLAGKSTCLCE